MNLTNPDLSWRYVCFYFQVSLLETGWKMTNMPFRSQRFAKDWGFAKQLLPMASLETAVALKILGETGNLAAHGAAIVTSGDDMVGTGEADMLLLALE